MLSIWVLFQSKHLLNSINLCYYLIIKLNSLPKFLTEYGIKFPLQDRKLVVRAPVVGHISKEVWVVKTIAGGELCGFRQNPKFNKLRRNKK